MKEPYKELVNNIYKNVRKFYKDNLISFVVFGSVARGSTNPYSDIDILIVSENLPNGRTRRILDFIERIEKPLKGKIRKLREKGYFIEISPLIKKPEEVKIGGFIYLDMIEDAKIIYDKNDFFKNFLDQLKNKLKKYGAKKVYKKGAYYWIIKEKVDIKEEIEI